MKNNLDSEVLVRMLALSSEEILTDPTYSACENKTFIIVGGQPGSGKSTIIENIIDKYDRNIVKLNIDDIKDYHPKYKRMLASDPDSAHANVKEYSNYVVKELEIKLIGKEYNVLVERTFRDGDKTISSAKAFKQNGYNIEINVICVNEITSRVACIFRYEKDLLVNGVGRTVFAASHDEVYQNVPNTLQELVDSNLFDNIKICNRDGGILAESVKRDDVVSMYKQCREEIDFDFVSEQIWQAKGLMKMRNAPEPDLKELDKLYDQLCEIKNELQDDYSFER